MSQDGAPGYLLDCASILSMRRGLLLAPLLAAAALGLAGCGTTGEPATVPARLAAPPQTAKLDWLEPYTAKAPALVFGVTAFAVTADGWSADISVENRSDVGWKIVDRRHEDELGFGVMLFPTGESEGRGTAQQQPLASDDPGRHGLQAGAPGRAGAGDDMARDDLRAGRARGRALGENRVRALLERRRASQGSSDTGELVHGSHLPAGGGRRRPGVDSPRAPPLDTGSLTR